MEFETADRGGFAIMQLLTWGHGCIQKLASCTRKLGGEEMETTEMMIWERYYTAQSLTQTKRNPKPTLHKPSTKTVNQP